MSFFQWADIDQNAGNIIVGRIANIDYADLKADIEIQNQRTLRWSIAAEDIPIHYHCSEEVLVDDGEELKTVYPNSQDALGAQAFSNGDSVLVLYTNPGNKDPYIIGFSGGSRPCASFVDNLTVSYKRFDDDAVKDYSQMGGNGWYIWVALSEETDEPILLTVVEKRSGGYWLKLNEGGHWSTDWEGHTGSTDPTCWVNKDELVRWRPQDIYEDEIPGPPVTDEFTAVSDFGNYSGTFELQAYGELTLIPSPSSQFWKISLENYTLSAYGGWGTYSFTNTLNETGGSFGTQSDNERIWRPGKSVDGRDSFRVYDSDGNNAPAGVVTEWVPGNVVQYFHAGIEAGIPNCTWGMHLVETKYGIPGGIPHGGTSDDPYYASIPTDLRPNVPCLVQDNVPAYTDSDGYAVYTYYYHRDDYNWPKCYYTTQYEASWYHWTGSEWEYVTKIMITPVGTQSGWTYTRPPNP